MKYTIPFKGTSKKDISLVGGKNASLGEMITELSPKGVQVPGGFAVTTKGYEYFLEVNDLGEKLEKIFSNLDPDSISSIQKIGKKARKLIRRSSFPKDLEEEILESYSLLSKGYDQESTDVSVRSSGVAEDAPQDSFAGQFETFLNIEGKKDLLKSIKGCIASSFGDRVIAYREEKGIDHLEFALSVGVQKMVRSDKASSGVIFTLDTETGFDNVVLINSIYGVGEMIVKGEIIPDEFYVFKPKAKRGFDSIIKKELGRKSKKLIYGRRGLKEVGVDEEDGNRFSINDEEVMTLASWAMIIEEHYDRPQDIEWAKDGETGELFIVQSRPETVHAVDDGRSYKEYEIKSESDPVLKGIAIGDKIGQGEVQVINNVSKISDFKKGSVLVTGMTNPDWVPAMRIASAIVTDEGSKVCHAAIVSRELGIPCIVGTEEATEVLEGEVTVDCTQGLDGRIYEGLVDYDVEEYNLDEVPELSVKIMVNIGSPEIAFKTSFLPVEGVGLAREEFIIADNIGIHPLALYHYDKLEGEVKEKVDEMTIEHDDKREFFVKELAEGIGQITAAFYPREVILRLSDFRSNEYYNLVGGSLYEDEDESNPMLGFRGVSRYLDEDWRPAFDMELEAIRRVIEVFGLNNLSVMVPFCRTVEEGRAVVELLREGGIKDIPLYVMCEIPSNIILADEFLEIFDGMSIGSNDLTQMTLGVDRDNAQLASVADERNEAVKEMVRQAIKACKDSGKYSGICGEAPSTFLEFAEFLIEEGIESISLSPDVVLKTIMKLGEENGG